MIECGAFGHMTAVLNPVKGRLQMTYIKKIVSQNKFFRCKIIHNSMSLTHPHPKRLTSFMHVPKNKNFICLFLLSQFLKIYDFMSSSNFSYLLFYCWHTWQSLERENLCYWYPRGHIYFIFSFHMLMKLYFFSFI